MILFYSCLNMLLFFRYYFFLYCICIKSHFGFRKRERKRCFTSHNTIIYTFGASVLPLFSLSTPLAF